MSTAADLDPFFSLETRDDIPEAPTPDLSQARAFLEALTAEKNPAVTFQTFSDVKPKAGRDPLAKWMHGTLEQHAEELRRRNEQGAGIFVMVNQGDGRGRSAKNVTRIRALYADRDRPDARPPALAPSFSVATSPGKRHDYLLVAGEMPLEDFTPFQEALADYCGSDRSVGDLPRVARLPGYYHGKKERVLVTFEPGCGHAYTVAALRAAHPVVPVGPKRPALAKPKTTSPRPAAGTRREKLMQIVREKAEARSWTEGDRHASAKKTTVHARKLGLEEAEFCPIVADLLERAGKTREEAEELAEWAVRQVAPDPKEAERPPKADTKAREPAAEAPADEGSADAPADEEPERRSAAAELIAIGRRGELFHDERGDGYAAFETNGTRRVLKMRSADFTRELQRRFAAAHEYKRAANGEALASARAVLEALATFEGKTISLTNRYARQDGALWIDTADARWRAVRITPGRWELVTRPPLLFRRYPHQQPLAEPVTGGDARRLTAPFALSEDDRLLVVTWVAVALVGDIPRPVLCTHGPQGAGKTTLLKMILGVLDPSGADDLDLGSEPRELAQVLDAHAVCFFDNLSKITDWQARLLCKAATGGGFEKRRLFTDEDSIILTFKRAVCFTGINIPSIAPDLLDRTLLVPMERMTPEKRRQETDLWREYEEARPAILGGLLDALAAAMKIVPTLRLPELPRMADFATWGEAVSRTLGYADGRFLEAYRANVKGQMDEVLDSDPVARGVLELLTEDAPTFTGTTAALMAHFHEKLETEMKDRDSGWPRTSQGLGRRLRVLHATLNDAGITMLWDRRPGGNRTRTLTLSRAVNIGKETSQTSLSSPPTGTLGTFDSPFSRVDGESVRRVVP